MQNKNVFGGRSNVFLNGTNPLLTYRIFKQAHSVSLNKLISMNSWIGLLKYLMYADQCTAAMPANLKDAIKRYCDMIDKGIFEETYYFLPALSTVLHAVLKAGVLLPRQRERVTHPVRQNWQLTISSYIIFLPL